MDEETEDLWDEINHDQSAVEIGFETTCVWLKVLFQQWHSGILKKLPSSTSFYGLDFLLLRYLSLFYPGQLS